MAETDIDSCASSYLAFRHVVGERSWRPGFAPRPATTSARERCMVKSDRQLLAALERVLDELAPGPETGLLLSGGIDSAILAALLPHGTRAYTIRFLAQDAVDETGRAACYARFARLEHRVVEVGWGDHKRHLDRLMVHKRAPLHPVEVGLYLAARQARRDGVRRLIVGNGADSNFGGLDRLLARDWSLEEFARRYTFVAPAAVLARPVSVREVYERYRTLGGIDLARFLAEVHGQGVVQAFDNALAAVGVGMVAPYETLAHDGPLDLERIRSGDSKYLVRAAFRRLYPGFAVAEKVAFARPMEAWMAAWEGPKRREFRAGIALPSLTGEARFLIYCLERFLALIEGSAAIGAPLGEEACVAV